MTESGKPKAEIPVNNKNVFCFPLIFDFKVKNISAAPYIKNNSPKTANTGKSALCISVVSGIIKKPTINMKIKIIA